MPNMMSNEGDGKNVLKRLRLSETSFPNFSTTAITDENLIDLFYYFERFHLFKLIMLGHVWCLIGPLHC